VRVKQAREQEGKSICRMGTFFTSIFWAAGKELSVGKITIHVALECLHCLVVCYAEKEACVHVK
jgi:hypothetical protein